MRLYILSLVLIIGFEATNAVAQTKPVRLSINTDTFIETAPCISHDGNTIYFQSNRDGGFGIYQSIKVDTGWSSPQKIHLFDTTQAYKLQLVGGPSISKDGNTLYFCAVTRNDANTDVDIFQSQKNGNQWSTPIALGAPINSAKMDGFPSISSTGKDIYFVRQHLGRPGSSSCCTIYHSRLSNNNEWSIPMELPHTINFGCEYAPSIVSNDSTLIFSSSRSILNEERDLWISHLNSNSTWNKPVHLSVTNIGKDELFSSLTSNKEILYFSSEGDIFQVGMPSKYQTPDKFTFEAHILDSLTKKSIPAIVKYNPNKLEKVKASEVFSQSLDIEKIYDYTIESPNYHPLSVRINLKSDSTYATNQQWLLVPKIRAVSLQVSDSETRKGLSAHLRITNLDDPNDVVEINNPVGRDGQYTVNLREGNRYSIETSSQEGYTFSNTKVEVPSYLTSIDPFFEENSIYPNRSSRPTIKGIVSLDTLTTVEIPVAPVHKGTKLVLNDIYFNFNSFDILPASFPELDRVIGLMHENPTISIEISAHTDDIGSATSNQKLSEKRAKVIANYLKDKGINPNKLVAKGYGKTKPVVPNTSDENRARNRRVELKIVDLK